MKKIISIFLVLTISFFTNSKIAIAIDDNVTTNEKIQREGTNDNKVNDDSLKYNKDDIFGDEQTFPFVAGLGKNAAH